MPKPKLYLAGFGVYVGLEIGGYKISSVNCGHETISRYHVYEYPCEITFAKVQQSATPDGLLKEFLDYVSGTKYIDSEYGNPYRCEFGTPKITNRNNNSVVIQSRGKSVRVSRSEVPSVAKPTPPSLSFSMMSQSSSSLIPSTTSLIPSTTSLIPSTSSLVSKEFSSSSSVLESNTFRSSMTRSPRRILIPTFASSSAGGNPSNPSSTTEQYNHFSVRPISPSRKIEPIAYSNSILNARSRTPPKIEAAPFELMTSNKKPTLFSLLLPSS